MTIYKTDDALHYARRLFSGVLAVVLESGVRTEFLYGISGTPFKNKITSDLRNVCQKSLRNFIEYITCSLHFSKVLLNLK